MVRLICRTGSHNTTPVLSHTHPPTTATTRGPAALLLVLACLAAVAQGFLQAGPLRSSVPAVRVRRGGGVRMMAAAPSKVRQEGVSDARENKVNRTGRFDELIRRDPPMPTYTTPTAQLAVMVNGLPGAMGKEVAAAVLRRCVLYVCICVHIWWWRGIIDACTPKI